MKRFFKRVFYVIVFFVLLRACGWITISDHEHKWIHATCTEPQTCSSCKKTEGAPLGHDWSEATCAAPKTCRRCNTTEGLRTNHVWVSATCTEPEACSVCGKKRHWYSLPLGHDWQDATCSTPKTCSQCGVTEGEPQHYFISYAWETTIEPTCQSKGERSHTCKLCNEVETQVLPAVDHKAGDWQVTKEATPTSEGTKKRYCVMCGIEMDSMQYQYLDLRGSGTNSGSSNFNTYDNESQQETTASYVLNTSSRKFHYPSCRSVKKISPNNYSTSSSSRDDLISRGYDPCGICHP